MARSRLTPVFVVLTALTLFLGGMLSYKLISGVGTTAPGSAVWTNQTRAHSEGIGIEGKVAIEVYSASGLLKTTWRGHNSLHPYAINAIAGCTSGLTTTPRYFGACGVAQINSIQIGAGSITATAAATNTALPAGCKPGALGIWCTGWASTATIDITQAGTYNQAQAGYNDVTTGFAFFDTVTISPGLVLKVGDRAVVTITFTVS
jgi:hypothetical protein